MTEQKRTPFVVSKVKITTEIETAAASVNAVDVAAAMTEHAAKVARLDEALKEIGITATMPDATITSKLAPVDKPKAAPEREPSTTNTEHPPAEHDEDSAA